MRLAVMSAPAVASVRAPPSNQAAGRHRRVRNRPVGKSRNTRASMESGITQIQLDSHMPARAAGHDPGAATRPCSP